jgi:hypothetical protein
MTNLLMIAPRVLRKEEVFRSNDELRQKEKSEGLRLPDLLVGHYDSNEFSRVMSSANEPALRTLSVRQPFRKPSAHPPNADGIGRSA